MNSPAPAQETPAGPSIPAVPPWRPMSLGSRAEGWLLLVFFLASGASGLVLEVVWSRMLTLVFGSTSLAYATVLAAFMGGLALGAFLASRCADRIRNPLLVYGILEGIVAICALALPLYLDALVPLYQGVWRTWSPSFLAFSLLRFGLAASALIVPTTCMGATLPILGRYYAERKAGLGLQVSHLYAANTWGAFAGTLAAGFAFLPIFGESATIRIAAGINLSIFLVIAGLWCAGACRGAAAAPARPAGEASTLAAPAPLSRWIVSAAILAYFGSGLAGMAAQVAWTRALSLVIGSSVYAFTAVVAAYLAGIAAGSSAYAAWGRRVRRDPAWLATAHLLAGVSMIVGIYLFPALPYLSYGLHVKFMDSPRVILLVQVLISILLIFPSAFFLGAIFPATAKVCARSPGRVGRDIGRAYASNTLGAIVGSFIGGFIFLFVDALGLQEGLWIGRPILVWTIGFGGVCLCLGALAVSAATAAFGEGEGRRGSRGLAAAAVYLPLILVGVLPTYVESNGFAGFARSLRLTTRPPGERLRVIEGPEKGISYLLEHRWPRERDWTVGRDPQNRIPLSDETLPPRAARFNIQWDPWVVEALGGRVLVNGAKVRRQGLSPGDRILLGNSAYTFESDPETSDGYRLSIEGKESTFPLDSRSGREWIAGTDPSCSLPIEGREIAPRHARFIRPKRWEIEALKQDDKRLAEVLVEGKPVEKQLLEFGDRIRIGKSALVFEREPAVRLWDPTLMTSGVFYDLDDAEPGDDPRRDDDPVFYREGVTTTVAVFQDSIRDENLYYLVVNGKVDASTRGDMKTQVLLAHLPILAHPSRAPKDVLVIGWGSGTTVGSTLNYPPGEVRKVLACELEKSVIEGSRWFEGVNSKPRRHLESGRLEIQNNDARNYLLATDRAFDIIISEPSNPWISGAAKLFTNDFYQSASRRLKPDGIWCQWIQAYGLKETDFKVLLRTFRETFPHMAIFTDYGSDLYVLGSKSPIAFDAAAIEEFFLKNPDVARDLERKNVEIRNVDELLAHHIFGTRTLAEFLGKGEIPLNTDDNAHIEFSTPLSLNSDERSEIDDALVAAIDPEGAPLAPDPRPGRRDERLRAIAAWHARAARNSAAADMLDGVVGRNPGSAGAHAERARVRLAKAKAEKRTALEGILDPGAPFREAASDLAEALRLDPKDPIARAALEEFTKTVSRKGAAQFESLVPFLSPDDGAAPPTHGPGEPIESLKGAN